MLKSILVAGLLTAGASAALAADKGIAGGTPSRAMTSVDAPEHGCELGADSWLPGTLQIDRGSSAAAAEPAPNRRFERAPALEDCAFA